MKKLLKLLLKEGNKTFVKSSWGLCGFANHLQKHGEINEKNAINFINSLNSTGQNQIPLTMTLMKKNPNSIGKWDAGHQEKDGSNIKLKR